MRRFYGQKIGTFRLGGGSLADTSHRLGQAAEAEDRINKINRIIPSCTSCPRIRCILPSGPEDLPGPRMDPRAEAEEPLPARLASFIRQ